MGKDPDYRYSLANERTFLAWIRTALALVAAGVGIIVLLPNLGTVGGRRIVGFALLALALLVAGTSYQRWERNERSLRLGAPLPRSVVLPILAYGLLAVTVVVVVLLVLA